MSSGRKKTEFLYKIFGIVTGLEGKYKVSHNTKKLGAGFECRRPRRQDQPVSVIRQQGLLNPRLTPAGAGVL